MLKDKPLRLPLKDLPLKALFILGRQINLSPSAPAVSGNANL
jgi:hypothetical protein